MRNWKWLLAVAGLATMLALPASASAASLQTIYRDFAKDGKIGTCTYTAADLQNALDSVPTDIAQYDPRFVDQLNRALEARSSGQCGGGGDPGTAVTPGGGSVGGSTSLPPAGIAPGGLGDVAPDGAPKPAGVPVNVEPIEAQTLDANLDPDRGFPLALALLGGVVALVLLGVGGLALAQRRGWDPASGFDRFAGKLRGLGSGLRAKLAR